MNAIYNARFDTISNFAINDNIDSNEVEVIQSSLMLTNQNKTLSSDYLSAISTNNIGSEGYLGNNKRVPTDHNYSDMHNGRSYSKENKV